jgi:cysteinyl-tRNA synthetase
VRDVRIRDTLTGELATLTAGDGREAGIYACGPTTYGRIHVGNARPYVIFMLLRRFLEHEGFVPRLVINVTDVNDKIYDAARVEGMPSAEWARAMTDAYVEDTARLGLGRPDAEPRATETIDGIVSLISDLIESGHAYESGGDVYFRVRSFDDYGKLSNRRPDDMDQGEEAGAEELKEDRLDFALWKARKEGEDTAWPSPWGEGRPGWHIECSAMAEEELGTGFAIHGGGSDLVFPHHENEIAQSEAARGVPLARIWMHNGMVEIAEEKMSKSVGNIFQLATALDRYGSEAVIGFLVSGHYRQPIEFSSAALEESAARNERIRNFLRQPSAGSDPSPADAREPSAARGSDPREQGKSPFVRERHEAFLEALADDFNTPRALAELFDLIAEANRQPLAGAREAVVELLPLLGLEGLAESGQEADAEAEELLADRERARSERNFERADEIRDELAARGWEVRDTPDGARLVRSA